jgi:HAD superfamily phosphatase
LRADAVLFDLDGTLVDESKSYREAIRRTAQCLLSEPVAAEEALAIKHHAGLNNDWDATWALLAQRRGGAPLPPTAEERQTSEYRSLINIFQTYYLGSASWEHLSGETAPFVWERPLISRETLIVSRETLEELRPFQFGIATSRPRVEALMVLQQQDLEPYFPLHTLVAREDAPREKPDPAPLLELMGRLDCHRPVYVGDTVNDALATEAAGMPFVAVGPLLQDRDLPYWLPDVNELPALLLESPAGKGVFVNG